MTKQVVLITGASGFIGTALIARLKKRYYILGIDKVLYKDRDNSVLWYKADISDKKLLSKTFCEMKEKVSGKIDYVFHLAAYYDMLNEENKKYRETNENGTRYLLDNLMDFSVNNFIFASSTAVLTPALGDDKLNEESALGSMLYYGKSKIAAEKILLEYKKKIKVTIFRPSAVYSEDCRSIPLANKIAVIRRRSFGCRIFPGKGEGGLSYIHISDVLDAFEKAVSRSSEIPSGSIFILSEEDYIPNNKLYGLIYREIYGKYLNLICLPKWFVRASLYLINSVYSLSGKIFFFKPWMVDIVDKRYHFNVEKAEKELGWQPKFHLEQYMKVIIENLKRDTRRWFTINNIK